MTILRSLLFVPGNKANMLEKALGLTPDAFVPDMEDSVPAAEKANARATIARFLPRLAASGIPVIPRVNALDTEWIEDDLAAVVGPHIVGVSVGKVRGADDIGAISQLVGELERRAGSSVGHACGSCRGSRPPKPSSTSARSAARASASWPSRSAARTSRTTWASSASRTSRKSRTRARRCAWPPARHTCSRSTRPTSSSAIPTACATIRCAPRASASRAGSRFIPSRSAALNECFSPSAQEIAHAERVVAAFDEAERRGRASTSLDGWVIDVPVVKRARALLELARRARVER